ncbi:major facilitator superfamily domain-containing protein [Apiosordaria backusii]|uniref:Major facilitator superfamily domain-containing protein n=1 Tax=Apiosordaria backusii TaxID=314023 RepID=A0AA39ZY85_9PEZI|nr:major facilitator superfamily domain-containing protein [Apiosordaria backusii]
MEAPSRPDDSSPVYSSFSTSQKRFIITFAALAGWFSSISSFIYFPAIPFLVSDLQVSVQQVNLTVTSYLIMSGIFPSIVGSAADRFGRRPVFLLSLAIYVCANIGLGLQSSFGWLFGLRMLQSAGISGTFSIAYGVVGDLFTPAERGGYSGVISFFLNTPPSIGPIISGLLLLRWTWRSIFWLLAVSSAFVLILMLLFLPETARGIVVNGSTKPRRRYNRPFINHLIPPQRQIEATVETDKKSLDILNPFAALRLLSRPSTAISCLTYGINYSVYSCLQASLSTIFVERYGVSGFVAGVIYIPFGVGCALSAYTTGKLLDITYRQTAAKQGIVITKGKANDLTVFPIERARLRFIIFSTVSSAALVMGHGWALECTASLAVPLVLQFLTGVSIQMIFTSLNTLLVDVHQERPSTAQAANNFVRCEMAAGCLASLDALLQSVGPGWTFVAYGTAVMLEFLLLGLLWVKGMQWRQARVRTDGAI